MPTFARIQAGVVTQVFTLTGSMTASSFSAPGAQFVDVSVVSPVPEEGWSAIETNGAWAYTAQTPDLRPAARSALDTSDRTILRCYEHGVAVPADWTAYRATLRAIVSGSGASLPATPAYPPGT